MSPSSNSAIRESAIDISHLEREIQRDVAAYRRHTAEDGMKKRAIHASKDYDEFRKFVSVSQLKPTCGRDVSSLFSGEAGALARGSGVRSRKVRGGQAAVGGFQDILQRRNDAATSATPAVTLDGHLPTKAPENTSARTATSSRDACAFLHEWTRRCSTATGTLAFLARTRDGAEAWERRLLLPPEATCDAYFSIDIDSEVVGNIVEALHLLMRAKGTDAVPHSNDNRDGSHCTEDSGRIPDILSSESNASWFARGWLHALPRCGRFQLSVAFLNPRQQLEWKEIRNHFLPTCERTAF